MNLLFDYDGTLHECGRIYCAAFRRVDRQLTQAGKVPPRERSDAEIVRWLGYGARDMWEDYAPRLSASEKEQGSAVIGQEMLCSIAAGEARLYPHTEEILDRLKVAGHALIFLSNCKTAYLEAHRQHFQLDRWFTAYYCTEMYDWQPKTAVFPRIRAEHPGNYVVIGDRFHDMEVARQFALPSVGCLYGYGSSKELADASACISCIDELPETIQRLG